MGNYGDDDDLGLSSMMARNVNAATSRPARDRMDRSWQGRDRGRSTSRTQPRTQPGGVYTRRNETPRSMDYVATAPRRRGRSYDGFRDYPGEKSDVDRSTRSERTRRNKSMDGDLKTDKKKKRKEEKSSKGKSKEKSKEKSKPKKKSKKVKPTADDDDAVSYTGSTTSSKASKKKGDKKNKQSKEKKSQKVETIRESASSNERTVVDNETDNLVPSPVPEENTADIRNEMDSLFPSPSPEQKKKLTAAVEGGTGNNEESSFDELIPTLNDSGSSLHSARSQKKEAAGKSVFHIMSNKAASEQAAAALHRVATRQQMENVMHHHSASSFGSGMDLSWRSEQRSDQRSVGRYARRHSNASAADDLSLKSGGSHNSFRSRRSRDKNSLRIRQKILDEFKKEAEDLQKELSDALAEVAELKTNLEAKEKHSKEAAEEHSVLKTKLEYRLEEKAFLIASVRDMENDFVIRNEHVEKLKQLVDTHLDTVEFLEKKLEQTEEEIVTMDNELNAVADAIEGKNGKSGNLKNIHLSKKAKRSARLGSIRQELRDIKGTISMQKAKSRRVLSEQEPSTTSQSGTELDNNFKSRQEMLESREEELNKRERELLEFEQRLKEENAKMVEGQSKDGVVQEASRVALNDNAELMKLRLENENLRMKLDGVMKTTAEGSAIDADQDKALTTAMSTKARELSDALAVLDKKNEVIKSLEDEVKKIHENFETNKGDLSHAQSLLSVKNEVIKSLEEEVENLAEKYRNANNAGRPSDGDLSNAALVDEKNDVIKSLEEEIDKLKKRGQIVADLSNTTAIGDKENEVTKALEDQIEDLTKKVSDARALVEKKNNLIKGLEEDVEKLQEKNSNASDLSNALDLLGKKKEIIKSLEEEVEMLKNKGTATNGEDDGKDVLIRELQSQLVNTKKQADQLSSGSHVTKLKHEIKALKDNVSGLKLRVKKEQSLAETNLKKKDAAIRLVEKKMEKLTFELDRREKRSSTIGISPQISQSKLEMLVEDLEEEVIHWKSANADLQNEIEQLKASGNLQQDSFHSNTESLDDDCSTGSSNSFISELNVSEHSFTSSSRSAQSNDTKPSKARRRMSTLWSKMTGTGEPPKPNQPNPYATGILDDD